MEVWEAVLAVKLDGRYFVRCEVRRATCTVSGLKDHVTQLGQKVCR